MNRKRTLDYYSFRYGCLSWRNLSLQIHFTQKARNLVAAIRIAMGYRITMKNVSWIGSIPISSSTRMKMRTSSRKQPFYIKSHPYEPKIINLRTIITFSSLTAP